MSYIGKGTLVHLVKEEIQRRDRLNKMVESGEYFKDHPHQKEDDKSHDVDFKTKESDNTKGNESDKKLQRKDPHVEKQGSVDKKTKDQQDGNLPEPEDKKNWDNQDFYKKEFKVSEKDKDDSGEAKEDSSKNVKPGVYRK